VAILANCSAFGVSCILTSPIKTVRSFETIIDIDKKLSSFFGEITFVISLKHLPKGLVTPVIIASASPADTIDAAKTFLSWFINL
jgi:hypothetical protein